MEVIFIVFILLSFYTFISFRKDKITNLSLEKSINLKGLFSLMVIITHMGMAAELHLGQTATIACSNFFFLSGYGLYAGYQNKKENYLIGFFRKRFIKLLISWITSIIIYQAFLYFYYGKCYFLKITSFEALNEKALLAFDWFLIDLSIFYIIFYVSVKWFKNILSIIACFTLIFIVSKFQQKVCCYENNAWWFFSNFGFVTGMATSYFSKQIKEVMLSYGKQITFIVFLFFLSTAFIYSKVWWYYLSIMPFFVYILSLNSNKWHNKILQYFGKISYEFYTIQMVAIMTCRIFLEPNTWTYWGCTILILTLFASILHYADNKIYEVIKQ